MPFLDIFKKENSLDIKIKETFANPPMLHTERLDLVKISPEHAEDMYEYSRSDEVTKYLLWRSHPDEQYTRDYLKYIQYAVSPAYFLW